MTPTVIETLLPSDVANELLQAANVRTEVAFSRAWHTVAFAIVAAADLKLLTFDENGFMVLGDE